MIRKFINIFFLIIIFFIFLNILLIYIWPKITDYRINKGKFYPDKVLELIDIQPEQRANFFREMLINRKFEYHKFIVHYEQNTKNQKYLNVDFSSGRKIENNFNCTKNFFFFGSSNTFGYNVKDNHTIPAYFKKILSQKHDEMSYCVFNFGSAYYYSTQETIFFITKILKNKIKNNDFIFFIDGLSERGNQQTKVDESMRELFNYSNLKPWEKITFTAPLFFESLPIIQLYKRFFQNKNKKLKQNNFEFNEEEVFNIFQKNVNIRKSICNNFEVNCYTFLQPFPYISGIFDEKILLRNLPNKKDEFEKKFKLLKKTENIIDISDALDEMTQLSYIDAGHYSPKASLEIAKSIYSKIVKDLK
tara:strand:+ start:5355 stop:6437 length:1083 start_codon:yes stop_codon:yes gene_type:complete